MAELYKFFADTGTAHVFTLMILGVMFFGLLYWIWSTGNTAGNITRGQWIQIYILGFCCFLCAILAFGFVTTPQNAQNIVDLFHLNTPLNSASRQVQTFILYLIRLAM